MASKFQTKVKSIMQKNGYKVFNIIRFSDNGYPDLLCVKDGFKNVWIECKEVKDTLKPLQKVRIDELNSIGQIAFCLQNEKGVIYGNDTLWKSI